MSPFVDPNTIHNPSSGTISPSSWGDNVRDNLVFLSSPPRANVRHAGTATNVATGSTYVTLPADTEDVDTDGMHSTTTNTSRLTIATAGTFSVSTIVEIEANATGDRWIRLLKNGTTEIASIALPAHATRVWRGNLSIDVEGLIVGDYLETQARQFSGGTLTAKIVRFSALWRATS